MNCELENKGCLLFGTFLQNDGVFYFRYTYSVQKGNNPAVNLDTKGKLITAEKQQTFSLDLYFSLSYLFIIYVLLLYELGDCFEVLITISINLLCLSDFVKK
jgi:hypothetical protein